MRILVLNPGSSTLKYRLIDLVAGAGRCLAEGIVDHVPGDSTTQAARSVIDMAKGALIERLGCSAAEATDQLTAMEIMAVNPLRNAGSRRSHSYCG